MVSEIHLKKQQINYSYGQIGLRSYTTEQRYLPVPLFHQEQSWYCGPASVQMISTYLYGTTYSQDDIANYMGTTPSEGTEVPQMVNGVNYWSGTTFYSCEQISNVSIEHLRPQIIEKHGEKYIDFKDIKRYHYYA